MSARPIKDRGASRKLPRELKANRAQGPAVWAMAGGRISHCSLSS
jgi:hypothetical protein